MAENRSAVPGTIGFAVYLPVIVALTTAGNAPPYRIVACATLAAAIFYSGGLYLHARIRPRVTQTPTSAAFFSAVRQFCVIVSIILVPFASRVFSSIPEKRGQPAIVLYGLGLIAVALMAWVLFTGLQWSRAPRPSGNTEDGDHA